jgi:hypothetical protein
MKKYFMIFEYLIFFLLLNSFCLSQTLRIPQIRFAPPKYICYRTEAGHKIDIDGKIDELSWKKAPWTENFSDVKGSLGNLPMLWTRAKMLWDDNYLYIAAELQETDISGSLKNHDDTLFQDNNFEIFIDPDNDTHNYCEIEVNALNTVWDLLLLKPYRDMKKPAISGWDMKGLKTAVLINGTLNNSNDNDSSWIVEAALPWKSFIELTQMHLPPLDGDQWRVNLARTEWKKDLINGKHNKQLNPAVKSLRGTDYYWAWAPQGIVNFHYPEMWGYVQFSSDTVGSSATVEFNNKNSDAAKWFLRQIYYKEKNLFCKNGEI